MTMSDQKPAQVPERFRQPVEKPRTVADMAVGDTDFVEFSAIRIDRDWGVWIDPHAVVCQRGAGRDQPGPIRVDRLTDGFRVFLEYAANAHKKRWGRDEAVEKFQGFFPAIGVG